VDAQINRIRTTLADWGYRLGRDDDKLLPMVACQVFLLNRSPDVEDLDTDLFDRIRAEQLLPERRLNTLHAVQRAVAALGFCQPPRRTPPAAPQRPRAARRSGRSGCNAGTPPRR
jgi:hypothetical protein